jgi:replication factor C subunit 2/4
MNQELPWIEKYRPQKMDDISHHEEIIQMFKKCLQKNEMPHLLFYGPPGTGKTSTILAIARELFGKALFPLRVFELNASEERGINVVREKIVKYAKFTIADGTNDYGKEAPPFKIIILDEADSMTKEAQNALRVTIETYSKVTRFCFICNYITHIIEPIKSRCATFQFQPLSYDSMFKKLNTISKCENIKCSKSIIDTIINVSNGDMRKSIMILQNLNYTKNMRSKNNIDTPLSENDVMKIACHVDTNVCKKILTNVLNNDLISIKNMTKNIITQAISIDNLIIQLSKVIIEHDELDDDKKSKIINYASETQKKLLEGGDEYLQLMSLMCYIYQINNNINLPMINY